jgi:hypothetical protein
MIETTRQHDISHYVQSSYKHYVEDGGKLSKGEYCLALDFSRTFRYPFPSFSQAKNMLRQISQSLPKKYFLASHRDAIEHTYGALRENMHGQCTSMSDEQIFAEALLIHHHFAAYKSYKHSHPNIFTR